MTRILFLVLALLLTPQLAAAQSMPYGTKATLHSHHGTFASGLVDTRSGWTYSFPVKVTKTPAHRATRIVSHPHRHAQRRRRGHAAVRAPRGRYTASMLVTWYGATGSPMANGIYPSVGWAACGYDLALGQRVFVPGIGTLTCGDRIGYDPWRHIDVFGIPLGTGYRNVTVY